MDNTTKNISTEGLAFRYSLYIAEGAFLVLCNGVIVIAILYHRVLRERKELALPAALAFCDATDGLAAVLAGTGRNWYIAQGTAGLLVSRWDCFLKPWNWFWIWTNHIMDPTLLAISIDRLIAVGWPLFHYGLTASYGAFVVFLAWGPATVAWAISAYLSSRFEEKERPQLCHIEYVFNDNYYDLLKGWRVVLSTASVIVYVVVIIIFFRRNNQTPADGSSVPEALKEYNKVQRKITITLGISCIFTTFLYVLPTLARWILPHHMDVTSGRAASLMSMSYIIENINKLANIFLYSLRHKNIRLGIQYLFECKELTESAIKNAGTPADHQQTAFQHGGGTQSQPHNEPVAVEEL